jgi:hypothetical protein
MQTLDFGWFDCEIKDGQNGYLQEEFREGHREDRGRLRGMAKRRQKPSPFKLLPLSSKNCRQLD